MSLENSPFSSKNLRKTPKRFLTLLGITVEQFDLIFEKLQAFELEYQKNRHRLWRKSRVEKMLEKNSTTLREHLCITLLYLRQYNIQEVLATSFGISQAQISKIINRVSIHLEQVLPVPEKVTKALYETVKQISPETRKKHSATLIFDASEQPIERNADPDKQRKDYSGKKKGIIESSKS